jgi:hypothetical protein
VEGLQRLVEGVVLGRHALVEPRADLVEAAGHVEDGLLQALGVGRGQLRAELLVELLHAVLHVHVFHAQLLQRAAHLAQLDAQLLDLRRELVGLLALGLGLFVQVTRQAAQAEGDAGQQEAADHEQGRAGAVLGAGILDPGQLGGDLADGRDAHAGGGQKQAENTVQPWRGAETVLGTGTISLGGTASI